MLSSLICSADGPGVGVGEGGGVVDIGSEAEVAGLIFLSPILCCI